MPSFEAKDRRLRNSCCPSKGLEFESRVPLHPPPSQAGRLSCRCLTHAGMLPHDTFSEIRHELIRNAAFVSAHSERLVTSAAF